MAGERLKSEQQELLDRLLRDLDAAVDAELLARKDVQDARNAVQDARMQLRRPLYLWELKPVERLPEDCDLWDPIHDTYRKLVVCAHTGYDARMLAAQAGVDENNRASERNLISPWLQSTMTDIRQLGQAGKDMKPGVISRESVCG